MCSSCSMLILASCLFNCSSDICWVPSVIRPFFLYICLLHVYICFELIIQQGLWPGTQTGFVSCNNVHFKSLCSCCLQFWFLAVQMTLDIVIVGTALVKRKKKTTLTNLNLRLCAEALEKQLFCCSHFVVRSQTWSKGQGTQDISWTAHLNTEGRFQTDVSSEYLVQCKTEFTILGKACVYLI